MTSCDEWEGSKTTGKYPGYGRLTVGGRTYLAHRLIWEQEHGAIPDGLVVMHSCDNPSCISIEHLSIGTLRDNSRDMAAKGRAPGQQKTECPKGHAYTPENTMKSRGQRYCRECNRAAYRRWYYAQRLEAANA